MRWAVGVIGASLGVALCAFACSDDPSEEPASDAGSDAIDDVATDGGDSGLPPGTVTLAQGHVNAIALGATHVYWAEGAPNPPSGAVRRVPLAGGTAETLATTTTLVGALAVDATSVYFATAARTLMRVPIGGGTAEEIAKPASAFVNDIYAVAVDANGVFWLEGGNLKRAQHDGGAPLLIGSTQKDSALGIAIHDGNVWWTSFDKADFVGRVASAPANANGTQPSIIYATDEKEPWGIAAGAAGIFWTNQGTTANTFNDGTIRTKAPTGSIVSLATDLSTPAAIALDGMTLWFTNRGAKNPASVMKMATTGGAPAVFVDATGRKLSDAIAVDATRVYWSADDTLYATPK